MTLPVQVHTEPWDVNKRLAELRLDEETLIQAVRRGFAAFAACTPNHPPSFPGLASWAEAVCALGETLAPRGWRRVNESNLPLVIDDSGKTAITVSTADEETGRQGEIGPCTNSAKGPRTASAIRQNRSQLSLFGELESELLRAISGRINAADRATWILLMHRDMTAGEVRCELSRPIAMSEEGRVDAWIERIILRPVPFDPSAGVRTEGDAPQTPEIDLNIRRRA